MNLEKNTTEIHKEIATLPFRTKEEYLTWRDEWRANYNHLSDLIRRSKHDRKKVYFVKEKQTTAKQREEILALTNNISSSYIDEEGNWGYRTTIGKLKYLATNMLVTRAASKILSDQQRLAAKNGVAV